MEGFKSLRTCEINVCGLDFKVYKQIFLCEEILYYMVTIKKK